LALAGLLIAAGLHGTRRDRVLLSVVTVVSILFPVLFYAWVYRFSGFDLQGRYVIPALSLVPLVAGEIVLRNRARRPSRHGRWPAVAGIGFAAGFQLVAWWVAASHAASDSSPFWFLDRATWTPPLGWWPWTLMAIAATLGSAACAGALILTRGLPAPGGRSGVPRSA
jgi:hypothetical protein